MLAEAYNKQKLHRSFIKYRDWFQSSLKRSAIKKINKKLKSRAVLLWKFFYSFFELIEKYIKKEIVITNANKKEIRWNLREINERRIKKVKSKKILCKT